MRMCDQRHIRGAPLLPVLAGPRKPAVLLLVEHVQWLVTQLRELRAPSRAAPHGPIVEDGADAIDFLAVVDLIPERLEPSSERRRVSVPAMHQPRDVRQTDVAVLQLLVIEHPHTAVSHDLVSIEGEVHLLDSVAFGTAAELRLCACGAAAEENALVCSHICDHSIRDGWFRSTVPRGRVARGF